MHKFGAKNFHRIPNNLIAPITTNFQSINLQSRYIQNQHIPTNSQRGQFSSQNIQAEIHQFFFPRTIHSQFQSTFNLKPITKTCDTQSIREPTTIHTVSTNPSTRINPQISQHNHPQSTTQKRTIHRSNPIGQNQTTTTLTQTRRRHARITYEQNL